MRSNSVVLPGAVGSDDAQNFVLAELERHVVDGGQRAVALVETAHGENRPSGGAVAARPFLGHRGGRGALAVAVGRRRAFEEDRAQDVGPRQEFRGRATEADLALLHEVRRLGDGKRNVHRLLDEDDRRAAVANGAHDAEQLLDDHRGETERQFVDHEQARLGDEGLAEREHLLFPTRQVARGLIPAVTQDGKEVKDVFGRLLEVLGVTGVEPAGDLEVLLDAQRGEHALAAGYLHDAPRRDVVRHGVRDLLAVEQHTATRRRHETGDRA